MQAIQGQALAQRNYVGSLHQALNGPKAGPKSPLAKTPAGQAVKVR